MKKVLTPTVRKSYGVPQQNEHQMTTVRKINSLLSVGSTAPRILKHTTAGSTTITRSSPQQQQQSVISITNNHQMKCYVCDEPVGVQGQQLMDTVTSSSATKLPNKIGRVIGEAFLVIVRADDMVCKRCVNTFNQIDKVEADLEKLKGVIMSYICKKYSISNEDGDSVVIKQPATKMQKLNSGQYVATGATDSGEVNSIGDGSTTITRKVVVGHGGEVPALVRTTTTTSSTTPITRKVPMKIYKCMSCDFTTGDLKQFQPHYAVCPSTSSSAASANSSAEVHHSNSVANNSSVSSSNLSNSVKAATPTSSTVVRKVVTSASSTTSPATTGVLYTCNICQYRSRDKTVYEEHMRKHIKMKPFKCRICSMRFETRETASKHAKTHQTEYFKCGACSVSFPQRELLIKHFEVHKKDQQAGQQHVVIKTTTTQQAKQQQQQQQQESVTTQALLQETIDEALRGTGEEIDSKSIHFFSCNICSLTFIQENYYNQHMETHKREATSAASTTTASAKKTSATTKVTSIKTDSHAAQRRETAQATNGQSAIKTEINDDLESIFEKMHSDKTEGGSKQESFNIQSGGAEESMMETSTGIDMPVLDQGEEQQAAPSGPPVSMPSLDDDGDQNQQVAEGNATGEGDVPMEIEDMPNSVEGNDQIKFILNENGQLLQLDNHIITTDADGNQIIVQGADSEHLQQLLQSVAGMEGGTIQMIGGENNQMILVQQGDNEPQLIDASLLNADGQILIQQGHPDGEMSVDGTASQSSEDAQGQVHYEAADQQQQQVQQEEGEHQVPPASGEESSMDEMAAAAQQQAAEAEVQQEHPAEQEEVDETSQTSEPVAAHNEAEKPEVMTESSQDSQVEHAEEPKPETEEVEHEEGAEEELKNGEVKEDTKEDETVSTTTTEEKITSSSAQPESAEFGYF